MNCPRCSHELQPFHVGGVVVDACKGGCGGIWFDLFELQKMDEPDESAGALLEGMRVDLDLELELDLDERIGCPRCEGVTLMRQQHPADPGLMTDKCPACGGVWLDFGELFELRSANAAGGETKRSVKGLLGGLIG